MRVKKNIKAPTIPHKFPIPRAPFLPILSARKLAVSDPNTPPIKKTETIADQSILSPCIEITTSNRSCKLSLQKTFINCKNNHILKNNSQLVTGIEKKTIFLYEITFAGVLITPMLNPAGKADPKQHVTPANTRSGLHPTDSTLSSSSRI